MIPKSSDLAFEFSRLLRLHTTGEAMMLVVERNREESNPSICHSHDFVDANQVMLEAWTNLGGLEFHPFENEEAVRTWGKAWEIAKQTEFSHQAHG